MRCSQNPSRCYVLDERPARVRRIYFMARRLWGPGLISFDKTSKGWVELRVEGHGVVEEAGGINRFEMLERKLRRLCDQRNIKIHDLGV